jgi:hypothetical protein
LFQSLSCISPTSKEEKSKAFGTQKSVCRPKKQEKKNPDVVKNKIKTPNKNHVAFLRETRKDKDAKWKKIQSVTCE